MVTKKLTDQKFLEELVRSEQERHDDSDDLERRVQSQRESVKKLEAKRERLLDLYTEEIFGKAELQKRMDGLNTEIRTAKGLIDELEEQKSILESSFLQEKIEAVVGVFAEFEFLQRTEKRALLQRLMPSLLVGDDCSISRLVLCMESLDNRSRAAIKCIQIDKSLKTFELRLNPAYKITPENAIPQEKLPLNRWGTPKKEHYRTQDVCRLLGLKPDTLRWRI